VITYKFRLLPTKAQETAMTKWLEECRMLYNNFLGQRKKGWETQKKSFTKFDQNLMLPSIKETFPKLKTVHSQVLQNVSARVELAYHAFFRRIKRGQKPGYPRFKSFGRYDSFCFPSAANISLLDENIKLPKLGNVAGIFHREVKGTIKTVTIKRIHNKWFAFVASDSTNLRNVPKSDETVAIDVGIKTFATLSNGNNIENPRFFETKQKQLAKIQRRFQKARDDKDKRKIKIRRKSLSKIHEKIMNLRHNFVHQTTNSLVNRYGIIIVEDINVNSMIKKRWCNKQILDAAWGNFMDILTFKAECASRQVVKVNPAYTSQTCSKCGTRTLHELKDRTFKCSCGHEADRDNNASQNILALGLQSLAKA